MARNVFVTGATSGIGLCIAEAYAKYGDNVLISGRRAEVLAEVQGRLSKEYGVRVETLVLDVRVVVRMLKARSQQQLRLLVALMSS